MSLWERLACAVCVRSVRLAEGRRVRGVAQLVNHRAVRIARASLGNVDGMGEEV